MYLPSGSTGFVVMDATDPDYPVVIGQVDTPGGSGVVDVVGSHAFLGDGYSGLQVIDVSDPTIPQTVGSISLGGIVSDVRVSGNHVFVANPSVGIQVVDVSNVRSPVLTATYSAFDPFSLVIRDSLLFAAGRYGMVYVLDISDPESIVPIGDWIGAFDIRGIAADGDYLYLSTGMERKVLALDISNIANIHVVAEAETPRHSEGIDVWAGQVIVADIFGLIRYEALSWGGDPELPGLFELNDNYPNPFNTSTNISFTLEESAHVLIEVLNILGQRVDLLLDGRLQAGDRTIAWDATGFASGVYLCRMTVAGSSQTTKMVLLK